MFAFTALLIFSACNLLIPGRNGPSESKPRQLLVLAPPGSTSTATPFQPSLPTETPVVEATLPVSSTIQVLPSPTKVTRAQGKNWTDYPGPVVWPDIEIPAPVGILTQPAGQVNILLLGSDQRPYESGLRTDTIILLTLNPDQGTANLTSFPRDLYVYIPGYTVQRINTAFGYGGFDMLALTMEYNFGVYPDHYVLVNLWSFVEVIDSLGGIEVQVANDLCDHRDDYGTYCAWAGTQFMDGETALWYVRSRYTTNDLDRNRRQQEVLIGLFNKLLSVDGIRRARDLYEIYQDNVTTDMSFDQIITLSPLAAKLVDFSRIRHYYIGAPEVYNWVNYSGAQVLIPVREAVLRVMHQALNSGQ